MTSAGRDKQCPRGPKMPMKSPKMEAWALVGP